MLAIVSAELGVQATVTSESRVGDAPPVGGQPPRPFVAEILAPAVEVDLRQAGLSVRAGYAPRILWQTPNPVGSSEALILHSGVLAFDARTARTLSISGAARGSIGNPDYIALPQLLGTTQSTLPPIVTIASGSGLAGLQARATARLQLDLAANVFHWRWLDQPVGPAVTSQTLASLEPGATFHLTPRHDVGAGTVVGAAWYSNGAEVVTLTPRARWRARLSRLDDLRLSVGLTYARDVGSQPALGSRTSVLMPVGAAELDSRLFRIENVTVAVSAGAAVELFLDPVLGTADPRGAVRAGVLLGSANWTASARSEFATVLRTTPLPANPDETLIAASMSGRRRINDNFYAELGGRWANRAPALVSPDFVFRQRQIWGYFMLVGTTRALGRWAQ